MNAQASRLCLLCRVLQVLSPTYKQRNEDFRKLFKQLPDTERLIVGTWWRTSPRTPDDGRMDGWKGAGGLSVGGAALARAVWLWLAC